MKKIVLSFSIVALVLGLVFVLFCNKAANEIKSFEINKLSNGNALLDDYTSTIENDSIKIFVPYLVDFNLKADFSVASGTKVYCNGEEIESGKSTVNYQTPQQFKVVAENGEEKTYTVCIYNSGLPVIYLTTTEGQVITREEWIDETRMTVYNADGTVDYDSDPDLVKMRGHGNSTWAASTEKRPYAIKLNKKSSILGMPKHKRWVLLANYYDATLFRNTLSYHIAKTYTNQDWVPNGYNVELVLNGEHKGNYYFCERPRIHKKRVNGKYMIEADVKSGFHSCTIEGSKSHCAFYVKDPKVKEDTEEFSQLKNVINRFETALYGKDYDTLTTMIDLESFVDWYIMKEWSRDIDGNMHTSCYFTVMEDDKIKMGPLWDFDLAWGGVPVSEMGEGYNAYDGYYITTNTETQPLSVVTTSWFGEFIKMPAFQQLLKEKVLNINSHLDDIFEYIDENTERMILSASANEYGNPGAFGHTGGWSGGIYGRITRLFLDRWGMSSYPGRKPEDYRKHMNEMKYFLKARMEWFVKEVNKF